MAAYQRSNEQFRWILKVQFWVTFLVAVLAVMTGILAYQARQNIQVNVRPGISAPTVVAEGQMPPENIYNLALVVFQQLNRWRVDGSKDYPDQIRRMGAFLTDRFRGQLELDASERGSRSELLYRTRTLALPPEITYQPDRVKKIGDTVWVVQLDLELQETVRGQVIKNAIIRYPIRVIAYNVDTQFNPYGLLLDGFQQDPVRLTAEDLAKLKIVRKE